MCIQIHLFIIHITWRNKRSRVKFKSVAPCGRYTALAQLSLSRDPSLCFPARNSGLASRTQLARRALREFSTQSVHSSCLLLFFFSNATNVYVSKTSEIKNGHPARPWCRCAMRCRGKLQFWCPRPPMPPCIMHPAPPKAWGSILTWIKDTKCLVILAIGTFGP